MKTKHLTFLFLVFFVFSCTQQKNDCSNQSLIDLPLLGNIAPKNSRNIEASQWGIQAGTLVDTLLEKAANIGVKWTRLHTSWEQIEKEKGIYNWQETDEAFDAVLKHGITPFVTIGQGHRMYSGTGNYDDPELAAIYGESPAPPIGSEAELEAWLHFVGAVIDRYKGKITYWEIWNEPNHRKYWGAPPSGTDYGKLVSVTVEKIRSLQPEAKIIAGSLAGINAEYTDDFLSQCDPNQLDIISFHHYSDLPENRVYRIQEFLEVINKHNPKLEIWQGECGFPSHSRTTGFRARAPWGLNIQAKWLLRQSFVDTYFCRATMSNYFLLAHSGNLTPDIKREPMTGLNALFGYPEREGSRVHSDGINQKCILFREDQQPKPAYYAYQNLCAAMDAKYKVFNTNYSINVVDQGIFYGIGEYEDAYPSVPLLASYKTAENNHLIAVWLPWNSQEYLPKLGEVDIEVANAKFNTPVLVDPLSGAVFEVTDFENLDERVFLKNIPLADYPMIIVEKEEIQFDK